MANIATDLLAAFTADLRAAWWSVVNVRSTASSLQMLFDMARDGGSTVAVPAGSERPAIRTMIQIDGDIVTQADFELIKEWSPEQRAALLQEHQSLLRARLLSIDPRLTAGIAGWIALVRRLSLGAPVVTGGVGIGASAVTLTLDWLLWIVPYLLASLIPWAVRLVAPHVLRLLLRRGSLYLHRAAG